ncbi:MAG TPA: hypothetical protein VK493_17410 [Bryobacteraceae bacterium]|nr:hypothetical protein [Bryobacteraceae bacterium]
MATSLQPPPIKTPSAQDLTSLLPGKLVRARPLFDPEIVRRAARDSFVKLNPVTLIKNPVMFVVEVGAALVTIFLLRDIVTGGAAKSGFELQIALWLWFTVLFANFAEAMAEARGKAQADTLRKTKTDSMANRLLGKEGRSRSCFEAAFRRCCDRQNRGTDSGRRRSHRRDCHRG